MVKIKNMSVWMVCGVMISCSGAQPKPAAQPGEPPATSTSTEKVEAPPKVERRTDLDTARIEIWSPLDTQQVLRGLDAQREVARAYGDRKTMCEALEANGSDECGKNTECTSRIEPDCDMCHGGPLICIAKKSDEELSAFGKEQGMLRCLGMKGTKLHIYTGEPPAPTDQVYQQCLCDEPAIASIDAYVEQGVVRPNDSVGMCISEKALCEQNGGTFKKARLLGKVSPEDYDTLGLTVRPDMRFRFCNVSVTRPSEAAEDDAFAGVMEEDTCVVYRFKGHEVERMFAQEEGTPREVMYLPHTCDTP